MCAKFIRQASAAPRALGGRWRRCAALLLLVAAPAALPAAALADGFYVRAGLGLIQPLDTKFTDKDCASVTPAALYGCGAGPDGAPRGSAGGFGVAPGAEFGIGFTASQALRIESFIEYWPQFPFNGETNFLQSSRQQSVFAQMSLKAGMLAAYAALDEIGMPKLGPFRPFAGVGAGVAQARIRQTRMTFPRTSTYVPGGSHTGLAWMLTAGLELPLDDALTLEAAWRYADYGAVETGEGPGEVIWRDGSRVPLPLNLAPTRAALEGHALRLSLRFAF